MSADDFEVRILEPSEYDLWDHLSTKSPHGTIFHNSEFLKVVAESALSKLRIYGCFKGAELIGGCSLLVKGWGKIISRATSTGPLTPYGGFLLPAFDHTSVRKSELLQNEIIDVLCNRIQKDRYSSITITNSPDLSDIRPFIWRGWEGHVSYTYYIDVEGDFSSKFPRKVRRDIRKAGDEGLYVQRLDDAQIHHELLTQVFDRQNQGVPVKRIFFSTMLDLLKRKNCGGMWVARDASDNILASRIWVWDEKMAYDWTAASNQTFRDNGADKFLFVHLLEEMQKRGFGQVNMMHGNMRNLSYYAAGFNPILVPYYSVGKDAGMYGLLKRIKGLR